MQKLTLTMEGRLFAWARVGFPIEVQNVKLL